MRKISFALILTFLLLACATPDKYDIKLTKMIGESKAELVKEMGQPSAVKMLDNGDEVLAYVKANNVYIPSELYVYNQGALANENGDIYAPFIGPYDFTPYTENYGYSVEYICQTAFLLQNGVVTGWKWRGNDCVAY